MAGANPISARKRACVLSVERSSIRYGQRDFANCIIRVNTPQEEMMKEVFSAFGSEIFRPLVSLILPGVAALSGWFLLAMKNDKLYALVNNNHTEATFGLVIRAFRRISD